jgi:hypothetical protein
VVGFSCHGESRTSVARLPATSIRSSRRGHVLDALAPHAVVMEKSYIHIPIDGQWRSICKACYLTAGFADSAEELEAQEHIHVCGVLHPTLKPLIEPNNG